MRNMQAKPGRVLSGMYDFDLFRSFDFLVPARPPGELRAFQCAGTYVARNGVRAPAGRNDRREA